ncbi:ATP-binding protein [uncultured Desulfobacter sp.]|uniref:ATP-binding protein n=1 Tax=uncultured Desulfobacter sp. TaxID=240139 RepID=UPI002AABC2C9|nr:ATP-binding protein [uncultured Desulfobacter sp.]
MKLGFKGKLLLGFFTLLMVQGLVIFVWFSQAMKASVLKEIRNQGLSTATSLAVGLVEPLLATDYLRMKLLVDETTRLSNDIFYTFVLDPEGHILAHTFKDGFPVELKTVNPFSRTQGFSLKLLDTGTEKVYDYAVPITVKQDLLGILRLGLSHSRAEKIVGQILISTITIMVLAIFLAGLVGTLLANPVIRSIKRLHASSEQALRGNLNIHTAPTLARNCWDIMACNRTECPAYESHHHRCWYLAGTLCPTCVGGEYAKKIESCKNCRVYRQCSGDEIQSLAESFDAMTLSLKSNLSDLKRAEKILNEQKARLQTILDAIPDFISLQDVQGRYISVNKAFCDMLGRSQDQILGRFNKDLFPSVIAQRYDDEDASVLTSGTPLVKENKIKDPRGIKWLHVVKIPVPGKDFKSIGLVCSGRDISVFKEVQDQLTHAQKMESVGRLAAGVAHEINTPLGIILGYGQLLLEDFEKEGQVYQDVSAIVKQTKICAKIVKDLLNFSRSDESVTSQFDIHTALEEVIEVVEHTFGLNHVTIRRNFHPAPLYLNGDKEKIKQVFINLLHNAFDAIDSNGEIFVRTGKDETGKQMKICVTDTGCGIDKKNLQKIFDPFYTTKGPDKGTGLGLSVTFGIIKEHKGKIKAYSPPSDKSLSQGTEFVVLLPLDNEPAKGEHDG